MLLVDPVLLVLKLYPIEVVISFPFCIKLTMSQLLLLSLCNYCSFFSYVGGALVANLFHCYGLIYFGYSANYNTLGAFVIIVLIRSDLLNYLKKVNTIVITTESG